MAFYPVSLVKGGESRKKGGKTRKRGIREKKKEDVFLPILSSAEEGERGGKRERVGKGKGNYWES